MTATAQQRRGILLVEDDLDIRDAISQILEEEGYPIVPAANGLEGITRLREDPSRIGLVLLDLMMPVMNGWQFREEQLADPKLAEIPVVVMSADASAERRVAAIKAVAFLRKPIQLERLLDVVASACR